MTFSVFATGTAQVSGVYDVNHSVPMPAGTLTDKLLLIIVTTANNTGTVADVTSFTRLTPSASRNIHVFGKIGTASESTRTVDTTVSDTSAAWCVAVDSTDGWPVIGSVFVQEDLDAGIGAGTTITHNAYTAHADGGNCLLRVGTKAYDLTSITVSSVAATSGWDGAGFAAGPLNSSGMLSSAEVRQAATTSSESISSANRAITTWAASKTYRHSLTIELAPANPVTISVSDATIDPHPDTVVTITKTAVWNGTVSATIEGSTIPLTDINTTQKSFTLDIDDLLPSGAWNAISPLATATLEVTDSDGAFTTEVQIVFDVSLGEDYVPSPGSNIGEHLAVTGAVEGDPQFGFWHLGDGVRDKTISGTIDAGPGYFSPITLPTQGRLITFDESAGVWLAHADTEFFSQPTPDSTSTLHLSISIGISLS